jgi:hypothetical protein
VAPNRSTAGRAVLLPADAAIPLPYRESILMDVLELFPDIDLGPAPRNSGCRSPIGGRPSRRPQPAARPYRPPSATMRMLGGLRAQLRDGFDSIETSLRQLDQNVSRLGDTLASLSETADRSVVRLAALERAAGVIEAPAAPRVSRRRPMA